MPEHGAYPDMPYNPNDYQSNAKMGAIGGFSGAAGTPYSPPTLRERMVAERAAYAKRIEIVDGIIAKLDANPAAEEIVNALLKGGF